MGKPPVPMGNAVRGMPLSREDAADLAADDWEVPPARRFNKRTHVWCDESLTTDELYLVTVQVQQSDLVMFDKLARAGVIVLRRSAFMRMAFHNALAREAEVLDRNLQLGKMLDAARRDTARRDAAGGE